MRKHLPPISIAKLYVQASLDKEWEVKYELYTDREDRHQISKEEYFNEMTNQTKEQIENSFLEYRMGPSVNLKMVVAATLAL